MNSMKNLFDANISATKRSNEPAMKLIIYDGLHSMDPIVFMQTP